MLKQLTITNYLYIESATLDFHEGLNVVVGESGVGKSMLVNILSIPLGFSPGSEEIGPWGKHSQITMLFGSGELLHIEIGRKTTFTLNNESITAKKVREYFSQKMDVHSQNNYELIRGNQLAILDRFMTHQERETWEQYQKSYSEYRECLALVHHLGSQIFSETQREWVDFQRRELSFLELRSDEDDLLFEQLKRGQVGLDYAQHFSELTQMMDDLQSQIIKVLRKLSSQEHPALISLVTPLQSLECDADDIRFQLAKKEQDSEALSAEEVASIESRLNTLDTVKKKYQKTLPELITFLAELSEKLDNQEAYKHDLTQAKKREQESLTLAKALATQVSLNREKVSTRVIVSIQEYLGALGLDKSELAPSFVRKQAIDETGVDEFQFLIRVNIGSAFHALSKLSGGETSRIMLALKAGLRHACEVSTYVFDEIDSGVSGDIAMKVSEVIAQVAKTQQVIVMTHLPILAAKGTALFQMTKTFSENQTHVSVRSIVREQWDFVLSTLLPDGQSDQSKAYVKLLLKKSQND